MAVAREATPVSSAADIKEADLDREDLLTDLPQHVDHARDRGARPHPVSPGQDPGQLLHRPRQRGRGGGRGDRHAAPTTSAPRSSATWASTSPAAPSRGGSWPSTWAGATAWRHGKDGNVHMADIRLGLIAMVSHLPALMPVAVGCALAFKIRREPRVAVAWSGDGAMARGDAHEAMNLAARAPAARRLHRRQQPVRLLDAQPARSSASSTWPTAPPPTGSRASWSTAPTCSPSTARPTPRSRGARRRRPDAARAGDAADGGPRRPRRRVLRPPRAARGSGAPRIRSSATGAG